MPTLVLLGVRAVPLVLKKRAEKRRKSDLPIALAAAGSGFGVPIMQVNAVAGYLVVVAGALGGYLAGKAIERAIESEDERNQ